MARFMNTFTWNQAPNDEFYSLVAAEQENARKLMAEGKLLHLFLSEDNSGMAKRWKMCLLLLHRCHFVNL